MNKSIAKAQLFLLILSLLVFLTACGSLSIGAKPRTISGNATGYAGARTSLEAKLGNIRVGSGVIDSNGTFNLELDDPLPDAYLTSFFKDMITACPEIKVSVPEAKIITVAELSISGSVASLFQTSWNPNDKTAPEEVMLNARMYADRDVTITGTCPAIPGGGTSFPQEYSLNLKRGWNIVTVKIQHKGGTPLKQSFQSDNPSGMNWYYYPSNVITLN